MATRTTRITSVESKDTRKGTIYLLTTEDGTEYATTKREIARTAKQYEGKVAEIEYTERRNGDYVNRYLEDVRGGSEPQSSGSRGGGNDTERETRIMRQSAVKDAVPVWLSLPERDRTRTSLYEIATDHFAFYVGGLTAVAGDGFEPARRDDGDDIPF